MSISNKLSYLDLAITPNTKPQKKFVISILNSESCIETTSNDLPINIKALLLANFFDGKIAVKNQLEEIAARLGQLSSLTDQIKAHQQFGFFSRTADNEAKLRI